MPSASNPILNAQPHCDYDVIILGAGAAGLFCAFTAAQRGRRVLVLEKSNKVGKKILMSGGGRCNFTNHIVDAEHFLSENTHFCKAAFKRFSQWDFIAMVERHGIDYEERKHSQLFCLNSAKDILSMLLKECDQAGVDIKTHCDIQCIKAINLEANNEQSLGDKQALSDEENLKAQYQLTLTQKESTLLLHCHSFVVATGALSIPTLGGSGIGYTIAQQFDIDVIDRQAGLVPFMFSDMTKSMCERLAGLAIDIEVSCQQQSFRENLLFTHRGISGPVILQISNYWNPGNEITINLLPGDDAVVWLLESKNQQGKLLLKNVLSQKLANALVAELGELWWSELMSVRMAELTDKQLQTIGQQLNNWVLKPSATEGYRTAEVTLGGVDTAAISSKTMEVKTQPGLYFVGEVLDVTGHLGGYNFQWAWSSGYSAGLFV